MPERSKAVPDDTAVRVALWRALHLEADAPPPVFEDRVGLALAAPAEGWRERRDMSPFTRPFRASIVARARFVEDLVLEQAASGVGQYVAASTGVSMYLTREALAATLRDVASFAPGSTLVLSFLLPIELAEPELRPGIEAAARGARANGTPWLSFFATT